MPSIPPPSSISPISFTTEERQFKETLQLFSPTRPNKDKHLAVKQGTLCKISFLQLVWEKIKGIFLGKDATNAHLIKLTALEWMAKGVKYESAEDYPLIEALAKQTGLIPSTAIPDETQKNIQGLIKAIAQKLLPSQQKTEEKSNNSADNEEMTQEEEETTTLLEKIITQYGEKLDRFPEEIEKARYTFQNIYPKHKNRDDSPTSSEKEAFSQPEEDPKCAEKGGRKEETFASPAKLANFPSLTIPTEQPPIPASSSSVINRLTSFPGKTFKQLTESDLVKKHWKTAAAITAIAGGAAALYWQYSTLPANSPHTQSTDPTDYMQRLLSGADLQKPASYNDIFFDEPAILFDEPAPTPNCVDLTHAATNGLMSSLAYAPLIGIITSVAGLVYECFCSVKNQKNSEQEISCETNLDENKTPNERLIRLNNKLLELEKEFKPFSINATQKKLTVLYEELDNLDEILKFCENETNSLNQEDQETQFHEKLLEIYQRRESMFKFKAIGFKFNNRPKNNPEVAAQLIGNTRLIESIEFISGKKRIIKKPLPINTQQEIVLILKEEIAETIKNLEELVSSHILKISLPEEGQIKCKLLMEKMEEILPENLFNTTKNPIEKAFIHLANDEKNGLFWCDFSLLEDEEIQNALQALSLGNSILKNTVFSHLLIFSIGMQNDTPLITKQDFLYALSDLQQMQSVVFNILTDEEIELYKRFIQPPAREEKVALFIEKFLTTEKQLTALQNFFTQRTEALDLTEFYKNEIVTLYEGISFGNFYGSYETKSLKELTDTLSRIQSDFFNSEKAFEQLNKIYEALNLEDWQHLRNELPKIISNLQEISQDFDELPAICQEKWLEQMQNIIEEMKAIAANHFIDWETMEGTKAPSTMQECISQLNFAVKILLLIHSNIKQTIAVQEKLTTFQKKIKNLVVDLEKNEEKIKYAPPVKKEIRENWKEVRNETLNMISNELDELSLNQSPLIAEALNFLNEKIINTENILNESSFIFDKEQHLINALIHPIAKIEKTLSHILSAFSNSEQAFVLFHEIRERLPLGNWHQPQEEILKAIDLLQKISKNFDKLPQTCQERWLEETELMREAMINEMQATAVNYSIDWEKVMRVTEIPLTVEENTKISTVSPPTEKTLNPMEESLDQLANMMKSLTSHIQEANKEKLRPQWEVWRKEINETPPYDPFTDITVEKQIHNFKGLFLHQHKIVEGLYLGDYQSFLSIDPKYIIKHPFYNYDVPEIALQYIGNTKKAYKTAEEVETDKGGSALNIKRVICAAKRDVVNSKKDAWMNFEPDLEQENVQCLSIAIDDDAWTWEKIKPYFDQAFHEIDHALANGETILVHCMNGKNRSPTIVIAYLMNRCGVAYKEALNFVRKQRTIVDLSCGAPGDSSSTNEGLKNYQIELGIPDL